MTIRTPLGRLRERKRRPMSRAGVALVALLGLCTALCTSALSASAASPRRLRCSASTTLLSACASATTLTSATAFVSVGEDESEESEEALEEDEEEAATAEAEAEEAEAGNADSATNGADNSGSVVLSRLQLTARTTAALTHRLPSVSAIGFSFTLSAPAKVQVTIVRQVSAGGHTHWSALPDSLTLSVAAGRSVRSLKGHNRLSPGRYRLTVKPATGHARSIYLSARR